MANIIQHAINGSTFFNEDDVPSSEEIRLRTLINNHFKNVDVKINRIEKIRNPYLYASFLIKKQELGEGTTVVELIHSTAEENIENIKKNNLDWRLVTRTKFGKGTSFSNNADYANYHSSRSGGTKKVFVICDVLVKKKTSVGQNWDEHPQPRDVDTYQSINDHVFVKFDDFTYYPKYALYYDKPLHTLSSFHCRGNRRH